MSSEELHNKIDDMIQRIATLEGAVTELSKEIQNLSHVFNPSGFSSSLVKLITSFFLGTFSWLGVLTYLMFRR